MKPIKCITGEIVNTYKEYLKTKHWAKVKAQFHAEHKKICVMCQGNKYLQVHHMTYANIGNEKEEDLAFLCNDCHKLIYKKLSKNQQQYIGILKEETANYTDKKCYFTRRMKPKVKKKKLPIYPCITSKIS